MVKQYRFLNFTAANREHNAFRSEGYAVSVIARDIITGGYYFEVHTR